MSCSVCMVFLFFLLAFALVLLSQGTPSVLLIGTNELDFLFSCFSPVKIVEHRHSTIFTLNDRTARVESVSTFDKSKSRIDREEKERGERGRNRRTNDTRNRFVYHCLLAKLG